MCRPCGTYGGEYRCVQVFLRKTEGKRKLEIFWGRWKYDIKIHLNEILWKLGVDWIGLAQNTKKWWSLMNTEMNL
jgi:hypothetical protein